MFMNPALPCWLCSFFHAGQSLAGRNERREAGVMALHLFFRLILFPIASLYRRDAFCVRAPKSSDRTGKGH